MRLIIEADDFGLSKSITELSIQCGFEWCREHPCKHIAPRKII